MHKATDTLRFLRNDPALAKKLYAATLAAALFMLVLVARGPEEQGRLVTDASGDVVGISRHSLTSAERYDVTVIVGDGDLAVRKDVTLQLRGARPEASGYMTSGNDEISREAEIDAEIDRMLTEIEYSEGESVDLPASLSDGTRVQWMARKQEERTGIVLVPFLYLIVVLALIKSAADSRSSAEKEARSEIMKGLPRFCNQLFLMMNAGLILSDAFEKICSSYSDYSEGSMSVFERELTGLLKENEGRRLSTAAMLSEYAARHNVKEMIRIATILTENERRGSDVIENLSRESKYLWDERKTVARENGKMIDMKMSWPLGLLLILLIVITMAPALLSM